MQASTGGVSCELKPLDAWAESAWLYVNNVGTTGGSRQVLRELANDLALPELRRVMPYHSPEQCEWISNNLEASASLNLAGLDSLQLPGLKKKIWP